MATRLEDRPVADDRASSGRLHDRSLTSLIGDLAYEATDLLRKEVELAKAEMSEKIDRAQAGVTSMAAGGAVLYAGFLVLLLAAVAALDAILDRWFDSNWLAPLIVGVVVLAIGYAMLRSGQSAMKGSNLMPRRTIRSLQHDARFAQSEAAQTRAVMESGVRNSTPSSEQVR